MEGRREFNSSRPYYLFGYGNGANIGFYNAYAHYSKYLRGVVSFNGYSYVDTHLAGFAFV